MHKSMPKNKNPQINFLRNLCNLWIFPQETL